MKIKTQISKSIHISLFGEEITTLKAILEIAQRNIVSGTDERKLAANLLTELEIAEEVRG